MIKKLFATFFIILVVGIAAMTAFLNSERGKLMILNALTERLEKQTPYSFSVDEWSFSLPCTLNAKHLVIREKEQPLATVEKASISLKPLALLNSKLIISNLYLEDVALSQSSSSKKAGFSFPAHHIELQAFEVNRLQLGSEQISVSGKATLDKENGCIMSNISLNNTQIFSSITLDEKNAGLYLRFVEPQNGYVTKNLSLPSHAPFACVVELSGEKSAWKQWLFADENPKNEALTGAVKLDYPNLEGSLGFTLTANSLIQLKEIVGKHKGISLEGATCFDSSLNIQSGQLTLSDEHNTLNCNLSGNLLKPAIEGIIDSAAIGTAALKGSLEYQKTNCLADLTLSSKQLGEIGLQTEISLEPRWPLTLRYQSESLQCLAEGNWSLSPEKFIIFLEKAEGKFLDFPLALKDPIILRDNELSPLHFNLDKGSVHITLDSFTDQFQTTTKARDLPYSLLQKFLPELPITSTVSLDARLYGKPTALQGHIQLELDKIQILDEMFATLPPLKASCRATLKDKSLECVGKIVGIGPDAVKLEAHLPYSATLKPPLLQTTLEDTFFAKFTASGDIAPYLQLFYTDTTQIKGKTDIAIEVTGPIHAPHITGKAKLYEGSFESRSFGTTFHNIDALIEGEGTHLVLKEISGTTEGQKTLTGSGQIHVSAKEGYPFNVAVVLKRAPFLQLDNAKITTSGELHIIGNSENSTVSGQLLVDSADFIIPKQVSSSIEEVEITYINQSEDEAPPTLKTKSETTWPMNLNVRLRAPGSVSLSGKDLNTKWKGEVLLTGETSAIRLFGDLYVTEGEYKLNGQVFRIDQGNINLAGEFSRQASLNIVAYQDIKQYRAEMVLKGPMNDPGLTFQSDPPLAQQEVLSLILFNKPLPDISSHQGEQLNKTFSNLSSQGDSANFLGKIRDVLGIDRIDITQNETVNVNDVSVRLGKYFYPGFYLFYDQSMPSDSKKVAVEANLMKELKMEAELNDDINGQIMLKWRHDY